MTDYLQEFDAADDEDKWPLVRRWLDNEPLPFFKALREQRPILVTPKATLVTRLDDCIEVLNQPRIFTVALYRPKMADYLMAHDDDALHTREKSLMKGFLNRDDLPHVRRMVARIAGDILDKADGSIEAVNNYCRMVPATLVQEYFGLTGVDRRELIEWSFWNQQDCFYNQPFDIVSDAERKHIIDEHERVGKDLGRYITELMARKFLAVKAEQAKNFVFALWYGLRKVIRLITGKKNEKLTDDIVTRMLRSHMADEVEFDLKRVGINAGGLLIGAIETTSQAVAQVVEFMLQHPQHLGAARAVAMHEDRTAFDDFVFEALRFVPISSFLFRQASTEAVIARGSDRETAVPAGGYVLAVTQSAMFDPRAFDDPDDFRPGRNKYHQFHFGWGDHTCLGRYVGAEMIPEMVRQLILKPNLRADSPIDYEGGHLPQKYPLSW